MCSHHILGCRPVQYHALVLCPNGPLCQQVASVVNSLRSDQGEPLLSAAQVNSSNPPPPTPPDFILATPAGLMTLLNDAGPSYGRLWTPEGMQARLRHVVLDEADLLLTSAYSKPVTQILQVSSALQRLARLYTCAARQSSVEHENASASTSQIMSGTEATGNPC
jgi:superfamily II DNA/RNA helicase